MLEHPNAYGNAASWFVIWNMSDVLHFGCCADRVQCIDAEYCQGVDILKILPGNVEFNSATFLF